MRLTSGLVALAPVAALTLIQQTIASEDTRAVSTIPKYVYDYGRYSPPIIEAFLVYFADTDYVIENSPAGVALQ